MSSTNTQNFTIALPIPQAARQQAQAFAQEQPARTKAQQVYLNTLAVLVVQDYLRLLDIPSQVEDSYSWNPVGRMCADVADLFLPGVGRLECRPVRMGDRTCSIPADVWSDRVGYVVVQIDSSCRQGTVLGFSPTAAATIALEHLESLDTLLDVLHTYSLPVETPIETAASSCAIDPLPSRSLTRLSQWFEEVFAAGWDAIADVLNPPQVGLAFRSGIANDRQPISDTAPHAIRRAKLIDFGIRLGTCTVALVVEVNSASDDRVGIRLQVHPMGSKYLPTDLRLIVQDQTGEMAEVRARKADNHIQLQFSGELEERFSITVVLDAIRVTEYFVI